MNELCIECKERPVHVKKRQLCRRCYVEWRTADSHGEANLSISDQIEAIQKRCQNTLDQIALRHKLTEAKILERSLKERDQASRASEYAKRVANGETLQDIGDSEGLTRERVRQVLCKFGYRTTLIKPKSKTAKPLSHEEKLYMMAWRLIFSVDVCGEDECWLWQGPKWQSNRTYCKTPYFVARTSGYDPIDSPLARNTSAPRLMYQMFMGDIPSDMQVDHICGNSLCCNPAHLQILTRKEHGTITQQRLKEKRAS